MYFLLCAHTPSIGLSSQWNFGIINLSNHGLLIKFLFQTYNYAFLVMLNTCLQLSSFLYSHPFPLKLISMVLSLSESRFSFNMHWLDYCQYQQFQKILLLYLYQKILLWVIWSKAILSSNFIHSKCSTSRIIMNSKCFRLFKILIKSIKPLFACNIKLFIFNHTACLNKVQICRNPRYL